MRSNAKKVTVQGIGFTVHSDFLARCTFAVNDTTGELKAIKRNGYISNELTIRKAIALAFNLESSRK